MNRNEPNRKTHPYRYAWWEEYMPKIGDTFISDGSVTGKVWNARERLQRERDQNAFNTIARARRIDGTNK